MNTNRGPGSPAALRRANRGRLVEELQASGPVSQAVLARATGLAPSTVSNLVHELETEGVVEIRVEERAGRRARRVRLAQGRGVVVGVDLGRAHLAVAVADLGRAILAEHRVGTTGERPVEESLAHVDQVIGRLLVEAGVERSDVRGAAVALPAPIDSRTGRVGSVSILPAWVGLEPAAVCTERLGFAVSVHNDTNLGALGEATWGAGAGVSHLAYVWVSEGVGSGLVLGGRPYAGVGGIAGEIGHTVHRNELGDLCRCGNRGCLETVVSTPALIRLLEPQLGPLTGFDEVIQLAADGDVLCRRVLAETGRHVGVAVANLVNLVDPQRVIIGGELARAGAPVVEAIRQMVEQYSIPSAAATVEIVPSALGERAEVLGAVAAALNELTFKL